MLDDLRNTLIGRFAGDPDKLGAAASCSLRQGLDMIGAVLDELTDLGYLLPGLPDTVLNEFIDLGREHGTHGGAWATAHRLILASDYEATVRQHLAALHADLAASKLANLRVEVAADVVVTVVGTETDTITVTDTVDVDEAAPTPGLLPPALRPPTGFVIVDTLAGAHLALDNGAHHVLLDPEHPAMAPWPADGMAQHATPEVRAADAIDPPAFLRSVSHRLNGLADGPGGNINEVRETLGAIADRLEAAGYDPATVDDVHRLAEAGGALAKAVDELLNNTRHTANPDDVVTDRTATYRLQDARERWGHARRGLAQVPAPRFVAVAREVAIAAGEVGGWVAARMPEGGVIGGAIIIGETELNTGLRLDNVLALALTAFDEVDTAYRADREAHARRIRLSD